MFGEEIEELLPVGLIADDLRVVRGAVVSALNTVAAYVAHCTDAAVVSSLAPFEVIGDREELTPYGHEVRADAIDDALGASP